jgi:uncharacterized protein (TIGR02271 family)
MALLKLKDFDPDYRGTSPEEDIHGFDVYSDLSNDKIGSVNDVLVDDNGHFRYLIVDLGFWIFGKKVLLPVGRSRIDRDARRVYALGLNRQQAENLPEYQDNQVPDFDYEERVRGVYRPQVMPPATATNATVMPEPGFNPMPVGSAVMPEPQDRAMAATPVAMPEPAVNSTFDRNTYNYQAEPFLYGMNEQDHKMLRLYEERLIADKNRVKTGEVTVGKHVETETARVAVPIEKERVVIERTTPVDAGTAVTPGEADFREGEVARIEVYEETPDIRKEAFVREEVHVRKEIERDTVEAQETIRREELDIKTEGNPVLDRGADTY